MIYSDLSLKREILLKEEERYQLTFMGATVNLQRAIDQTLFLYRDSFFDKTCFLACFYDKVINFHRFIDEQKYNNIRLKKRLSYMSDTYIKRRKSILHSPLDQELKCERVSIGWFFSSEIFDRYYKDFCSCKESFHTPASVDSFFMKCIDRQYPISLDTYVKYLRKNVSSFWEVTCTYIKELVDIVARYSPITFQQIVQGDLIKDSAWSDTYEILRSKLQKEDNFLLFKSGTDFRNYIIQICHFRLRNLSVKYMNREESLDFSSYLESQEAMEENDPVHFIQDVDIHNAYEVAYAISIILLTPEHPLYPVLTSGIEDKIDVLLRKVIKGQSYNTIVKEKYAFSPDSPDFVKTVTRTRKEYERVRKTLQERFIRMKKQEDVSHLVHSIDNR